MSLSYEDARSLAERPMNASETTAVLELLLSGALDEERGAQLLGTWAKRGESSTELGATVRFLRARALRVDAPVDCFDLCGTGGSGLARYNVSTTVAFIAASHGIPVAKHGNRGSRRPNGSFDLLEALGIPFGLAPAHNLELLEKTRICFLFARTHHPAVGKVAAYRKAIGRRTIFNLAGPLSNPAPLGHQLIGTTNAETARLVADALRELETKGSFVVWGAPGIDEISVTGPTGVLSVTATGVQEYHLDTPRHVGIDYASLPHGDASENQRTFAALLDGTLEGPLLDMVCVNAGAAIDLWEGRPPAYEGPGAKKARELLDSGAVRETFERHRALAQELAQK